MMVRPSLSLSLLATDTDSLDVDAVVIEVTVAEIITESPLSVNNDSFLVESAAYTPTLPSVEIDATLQVVMPFLIDEPEVGVEEIETEDDSVLLESASLVEGLSPLSPPDDWNRD